LTATSLDPGDVDDPEALSSGIVQIKYAIIVISTVPVLAAYFVVQKYFKTGVMIGSVKG
jgi:ABC-type glycerol-3-phosphate transport system permease component